MERRYSEITLKKRRFRIGIVLLAMLFILGACGTGVLKIFRTSILAASVKHVLPPIFKYMECEENKEKAPLVIRVFSPLIFAFTWSEESEKKLVQGQVELENISVSGQIEQGEESLNESEIYISVSQENVLSLLQENLFQEKSSFEQENVPNSFGQSFLGTELSLQIDNRSILKNYDLSAYYDMTQLIKDFYIVDSSTSPNKGLLDIDKLISYDCTLNKNSEGSQILIYHSHSQEGFADSVEGDTSTTIVGAGEKLARLLEEEYGYKVMHHTGIYDVPSRDNAYSNALPVIEKVLAENPSIQIVIDLHRDAVAEGTKLVKNIDGKEYARFMFFNGICRSTNGPITYLSNPYLQENLAFSFQAQVVAESYFPGITRKIYLKAWRYNMHLKPRNMLIELGAQTNTVEEVMNTTEILAFVIDKVLSGQ